jgi:hypothetical protein
MLNEQNVAHTREMKYRAYIKTCLEQEDMLASILHKLMKYGLEHEYAKRLVIEETLYFSRKVKMESTGKIVLAFIAFVILFFIGFQSEEGWRFFAAMGAPGVFAFHQWRVSSKRINYLNSLNSNSQ